MLFQSYSIVVLKLFIIIIVTEACENGDEDRVDRQLEPYELIERQIFEDADGVMEPRHTLGKLQVLKHALVNLDKQKVGREPHELYWLQKRVIDLIHHSVCNERKCHWEALHEFKAKLSYPSNSISIDNYLEYYWRKLLLACENYLDTTFRAKLDEMKYEDVRQLDLLQLSVLKSILFNFDRYSRSNLQILTPKILNYLEPNLKYGSESLLSCGKGKALFGQEFERLITSVCITMGKTLSPPLDIYKLYKEYIPLLKRKPVLALDWLNTYEICDIITENQKFYIHEVYSEYKKRHPKKTGLRKIHEYFSRS